MPERHDYQSVKSDERPIQASLFGIIPFLFSEPHSYPGLKPTTEKLIGITSELSPCFTTGVPEVVKALLQKPRVPAKCVG